MAKRLLAPVLGALFAMLVFAPLVFPMTDVTRGACLAVAGVVCIAGVFFGIREARAMENRRKTKEDIWINH